MKNKSKNNSLFSEANIKSGLFYTENYKVIETNIMDYLNSQSKDNLSLNSSVRTAGDTIPEVLKKEIKSILGEKTTDIRFPTTSKKTANIIFNWDDGMTYYLDIITHNLDKKFHMPNITSVEKLNKLYSDNSNIFIILLIEYEPSITKNYISNVSLIPIEFLSWDCLTIGAIGIGQIQIKKSSKIIINKNYSRKKWMNGFTEKLMEFYANENHKLSDRLLAANRTRLDWLKREDVWL